MGLPEEKETLYQQRKLELEQQENISILGFPKGRRKTIEEIFDYIANETFDLLVIDNLGRIELQDNININISMNSVVDKICDFASVSKRPVVLVHHFRKGGETKKQFRNIDSIAGSAKIFNDAEIVLQIAREADMADDYSSSMLHIREEKARECNMSKAQTIHYFNGNFVDTYPQQGFNA